MIRQDTHQITGLGGWTRTGNAQQPTLVVKGRKGFGRFGPKITVQDLAVQTAVHALAGTTGRKGIATTQEGLQHTRGDQIVRTPTTVQFDRHGYPNQTINRWIGQRHFAITTTVLRRDGRRGVGLLLERTVVVLSHFHQLFVTNTSTGHHYLFRIGPKILLQIVSHGIRRQITNVFHGTCNIREESETHPIVRTAAFCSRLGVMVLTKVWFAQLLVGPVGGMLDGLTEDNFRHHF